MSNSSPRSQNRFSSEYGLLAARQWVISMIHSRYIALIIILGIVAQGNPNLLAQIKTYHYYDGARLDMEILRWPLNDTTWVDSTIWIGFGYSEGPDTFGLRQENWVQFFRGKETVLFAKDSFLHKISTCQFADRDLVKFPGFLYYEWVPDEVIQPKRQGDPIYRFHFYEVYDHHREELCTLYFDPKVGIVRLTNLLEYDLCLKYISIDGRRNRKYRWKI